jgi:LuxR family maltose regulon positive regulatory protein
MSALAAPRRSLRIGRSRRIERVAEEVAPGRLRPPPLRPGVVERPHLLHRLEELTQAPLTVVSAPTGYGKTTLLASWAASASRPVAWASVGSRDLDADWFWTVVAAAVERVEPPLRFGLAWDRSAGDPAVQIATALGHLSGELTLVLDGYERAVHGGLDAAFDRFLNLAPEELHVVVSTRCEPRLALPLRRAHGRLAELALDDLRLDEDETAAILQRTLGSGTTTADAAALAERTEGWPAAVYLAALAGRTVLRPGDLLEGFSGATREVADYLRLELLDAQSNDLLRSFLLETSLLERLTGPLCDALLRRNDSEETLRALARGGAFLVPLPGAGHGYRYVRPVGEFLRAELVRVAPGRVGDIHLRAAAACERSGLFDEAAAHARAVAGEGEAANLLSRHALELVRDGHTGHLERVLDTRAGAAVAERRPALRAELRCLAGAGGDVSALGKAAERVAGLSGGLPSGPVRALVLSTAQAAQAYALLLAGSLAQAYDAGAAAHAGAEPDAAAPAAQAAAVASLAASRLGLGAAAAPLSRAAVSALARRGIRSGTAAALASLAAAAVAEAQGDARRAQRLCVDALERTEDPQARALALLRLTRLYLPAPEAARAALDEARVELSLCHGAVLLETLAAEVESELGSRERAQPATGELSPAEQRVLQLLATRLTQREIANELYVSLNTVKTHARVIYRKLGVGSRSAAVAAARELNLV